MCVHSWNEADALRRLVHSSLPALPIIHEWVILDHRSTDHTPGVIDDLEVMLARASVPLVRLHEARDLSATFTFADLRNLPLDAASSPLVMILDADFILGRDFLPNATRAIHALTKPESPYHAAAFRVPVVWDHLTTDDAGRVTRHGRVWWHSRRARVLHWPSVKYHQVGKWEKLKRTTTGRPKVLPLENTGSLLVSANTKTLDRLALRKTMTMFMEDATSGKLTGSWLEEYERGTLREMPPYPFDPLADLTSAYLHAPSLDLP
jgi:hypothetical protein